MGVFLYDAASGEELLIIETEDWVRQVVFAPNMEVIAAVLIDGTVQAWRLPDGESYHTYGKGRAIGEGIHRIQLSAFFYSSYSKGIWFFIR